MISRQILIITPLFFAFGSAILSSFYTVGKNWQNFVLGLIGALVLFYLGLFFTPSIAGTFSTPSFLEFSMDKFTVFIGAIFFVSLFTGLYPIRNKISLSPSFLYFIAGGLGIILSNNLSTFFLFWAFQRGIPFVRFIKDIRLGRTTGGGTYIVQHFLTAICFLIILNLAWQSGFLFTPFAEIPASFFSWPVLLFAFIVIYESHGIFPFHSWIHDVVGKLPWYEISSIFLARAGILLFVKFLLPTFNQDPDAFKLLLLTLSIFSSIYWSYRGILEQDVSKTTTYFYVAQSSLLLTGLQADLTAAHGAYLHMMVISLSGTALWSLLSYVQHSFSLKRSNQFYGLAQYYPKLATLFCLFGFCMIGVPLGASFVVEDLVITGLLEKQPYLGLGHIFATCLNGILFFLIFTKLFLGQSAYKQQVKNMDMPVKEMLPYVAVLLILFLIGIFPHLFLEKINW
jgi:NADH:ubiquinone oxidoreductase subunit 4 (subunit M)